MKLHKYFQVIRRHTLLVLLLFSSVFSVKAEDWVYKVRNGDNLWNLTTDYLIDISYVKQVQKLNKIADPWHILPGTTIRIPSEWIRHYPALVRVQNLQGTAHILEDESTQLHPLKQGDLVMLGDVISTGADSSLLLGFLDGSRILLQENSRLKIEQLMILEYTGMLDSQLQLQTGRIETQVAPDKGSARRFQVSTPATVTSVRGTDYRISADKEKSQSKTEVVEGKVLIKGRQKSRLLNAGFGTITVKDQDPMAPVKLLAAPDLSHIPHPFDQVPLQFSMPPHNDVKGYRVQIAKTELFQDVLFDKPFNSLIIRGPELPDGNYHLRVRGIDALQLEGNNGQASITINARPEAPFLVSPKPGEGILLEDKPELNWTQQQENNHYHVQISDRADFSRIVLNETDIAENELTVSKILPMGKYFWRIAAIDQDGDGPFSDAQMFRRIIPAPELEAPDLSDETLSIRSRSGLPGQRYHFQMSDNDSFDELIVDKYTDEPGFEVPRPNGGEYFIRVRTIDPDGFVGPFAAPQSIDVPYNYYWLLTLLPLLALIAL